MGVGGTIKVWFFHSRIPRPFLVTCSFIPGSPNTHIAFSMHVFHFPSLVKFIPKYFILFDAVINGVVFLISDSLC